MIKKVKKNKALLLLALGTLLLTGCSDGKSPKKGYLSQDKVNEIVNSFKDGSSTYTKYSYQGELNYFEYEENKVPRSISKRDAEYVDSPTMFDSKSSSYYLNLPLRITPTSWICEEKNSSGLSLSTQYQLESKIHRPDSLDNVYYYSRTGGGFYAKVFGANKPLLIVNPSQVTCRAKWNITVEYNELGYLVKEEFSTINSSKDHKSECCYGEATYTFAA